MNKLIILGNDKTANAHAALQHTYELIGEAFELSAPVTNNGNDDWSHNLDEGVATYWFHSDHLGSSSYITDDTGNVTQHLEYLPFGETLVEEHQNSNDTPYKFNGKELDDETGNYYYGARYYDPKFSFWLSVDPLAEQTKEPYSYVGNNPISFTDPTGKFKVPIHSRITKNAMAKMKFANTLLFRSDLQLGIQGADYVEFAADLHFDGRENFAEVNNTWTNLNNKINETTGNIGLGNRALGGLDVIALGKQLHTVQDFYAHSNYVELYVEYYQNNNGG